MNAAQVRKYWRKFLRDNAEKLRVAALTARLTSGRPEIVMSDDRIPKLVSGNVLYFCGSPTGREAEWVPQYQQIRMRLHRQAQVVSRVVLDDVSDAFLSAVLTSKQAAHALTPSP